MCNFEPKITMNTLNVFFLTGLPNKKWMVIYAIIFFISHGYTQQEVLIDSLQREVSYAQSDEKKQQSLIALSNLYLKTDDVKALSFADQALELAEISKNDKLLAKAYHNLGRSHSNLGNFDISMGYYLKTLHIYEALKDEKMVMTVKVGIGTIHEITQSHDLALEYYYKALHYFEHITADTLTLLDQKNTLVLYNNIGNICSSKGDYKKALDYYLKGLNFNKKHHNNWLKGNICNNIGRTYLMLNEHKKALAFYQIALDLRKKDKDKEGVAKSYRSLAEFYYEKGDYDQGLVYIKKALKLGENLHSNLLKHSSFQLEYLIYKEKEDFKNALRAHENLKTVNDQFLNENMINKLSKMEAQYEFDKKEKINALKQQKKEQVYIFIIVSMMLLIGLFTATVFMLKNRNKRIKLEKSNLELEKSKLTADIEFRNKELATNVMYLIQRNEGMNIISKKLADIKDDLKGPKKTIVKDILFELNTTTDDNLWKEFELRFQQVHTNFYEKLQTQFPDLTHADRKMAAFLKLGMSSKEISSITHQNIRTVEVARYRLRKKLNITNSDVNLVNFLNQL